MNLSLPPSSHPFESFPSTLSYVSIQSTPQKFHITLKNYYFALESSTLHFISHISSFSFLAYLSGTFLCPITTLMSTKPLERFDHEISAWSIAEHVPTPCLSAAYINNAGTRRDNKGISYYEPAWEKGRGRYALIVSRTDRQCKCVCVCEREAKKEK